MSDDLRRLVIYLEAKAQCTADTQSGAAYASALAGSAANIRYILRRHGEVCPSAVVYDSREAALAAVSENSP